MSTRPWWSHALQWALWFVIMSITMGWLNRMRQRPRPADQAGRLAHPVSTLLVGLVCTAFPVGILIVMHVWPNDTVTPWTTSGFLLFALLSSTMVLDYFRARHTVSDDGLAYRGLLRRGGFIRWRDVTRVRYAPTLKWFRVEAQDGQVARLSVMLMGLPEFARLLLAHAPAPAIEADARALLEATAAGSPPSVWI